MTNQMVQSSSDKSRLSLRTIIQSFVVFPFAVAFFAIAIFSGFRLLTAEPQTIHDYLDDIKSGGKTKKWQSAYLLSQKIHAGSSESSDSRFVASMIELFEEVPRREQKLKRFLSLAMGKSGNPAFSKVLISSLQSKGSGCIPEIATSLGMVGGPGAAAALIPLLSSEDAMVRLAVVQSLGTIGQAAAIVHLQRALEDSEPNVRWDAAVSLAKLGSVSASPMLLKLLDAEYYTDFPNVDIEEVKNARLVAIDAASLLDEPRLKESLIQISKNEPNFEIRKKAYQVLTN